MPRAKSKSKSKESSHEIEPDGDEQEKEEVFHVGTTMCLDFFQNVFVNFDILAYHHIEVITAAKVVEYVDGEVDWVRISSARHSALQPHV
jgi:hypothetical protein